MFISSVYLYIVGRGTSLHQHSIPILLASFSAKSANSTVFRIPILLVIEIFLCHAYCFRKTLQISDAQKNTP